MFSSIYDRVLTFSFFKIVCATNVIAVLNKIRSDLTQEPTKRNADGSVANKVGKATFLYSTAEFDLSSFKETVFSRGWDFSDPSKTKLLFLTHRLIAKRNGWDGILSAYSNNDMLLGNEPDRLATHLLKLGAIVTAYQKKNYSQVISSMSMKIRSNEDKRRISAFLNDILTDPTKTIDSVINEFNKQHILVVDDRLTEYIANNEERYNKAKDLPISQS